MTAEQCQFGDSPHPRAPAHTHPYEPAYPDMPRQCTCGSRRWEVSVAPGLPLAVTCARPACRRPSKIATAYERGRAAGPRERRAAGETPGF